MMSPSQQREPAPDSASVQYVKALSALRQGRLEEADELLRSAIKARPQDEDFLKARQLLAAAFLQRGMERFRKRSVQNVLKGDYAAPLFDLTKAIELEGDLAEAYAQRARVYQASGDIAAAARDIEQASQLRPTNQFYAEQAGEIFQKLGRRIEYAFREGRPADCIIFSDALALLQNPDAQIRQMRARSFLLLGRAALKDGDVQKAHEYTAQAMEEEQAVAWLKPRAGYDKLFWTGVFQTLGDVWSAKKEWPQAIDNYSKALEIDSKNASLWTARGEAYRNQGSYEAAADDYARALDEDTLSPQAWRHYANCLWHIGKLEESLKALYKAKVRAMGGSYTDAFFDGLREERNSVAAEFEKRAQARFDEGRLEEALADYKQALKLDPALLRAALGAARVCFDRGEESYDNKQYGDALDWMKEAARFFERSGTGNPKSLDYEPVFGANIYGRMCESYIKLDKPKKAEEALGKAAALEPQMHERLRIQLAGAFNEQGMRKRRELFESQSGGMTELGDFQKAVELDPNSAVFRYNLGMAAYERFRSNKNPGDFAISDKSLGQCLRLEPAFTQAYEIRARLRKEAGELEGAESDFTAWGDPRLAPQELMGLALDWRKRGDQRMEKSDWKKALEAYADALRLDPTAGGMDRKIRQASEQLLDIARLRFNEGDVESAMEDLTLILKLQPRNPRALLLAGDALLVMGRLEEAQGQYEKALAAAGDEWSVRKEAKEGLHTIAATWLERARRLESQEKDEQAMEAYAHALALDPKSVEAWLGRARIHKSGGNTQAAISDAEEALRLDPHSAEAYFVRGSIYHAMSDYENALPDIDEAIRSLDGQSRFRLLAECYYLRAEANRAAGRSAEFESDLTQCIAIFETIDIGAEYNESGGASDFRGPPPRPGVPPSTYSLAMENSLVPAGRKLGDAYFLRARLRMDAEDDILAEADLKRALALYERHGAPPIFKTQIHYHLATLQAERGEDRAALDSLNAAMATGARFASAFELRAEIQRRLGFYKEAWDDLDTVIAMQPDSASAYHARSRLCIEIMLPAEGERENGIEARKAGAYRHLKSGGIASLYVQAEQDAEKANELNPREEDYQSQLMQLATLAPLRGSRLCQSGHARQAIDALANWGIELDETQAGKLENYKPGRDAITLLDSKGRAYRAEWEKGMLNVYRAQTAEEMAGHEWLSTYARMSGAVGEYPASGELEGKLAQEGIALSGAQGQRVREWLASPGEPLVLVNANGERLIVTSVEGGRFSLHANDEEFDAVQALYKHWGEMQLSLDAVRSSEGGEPKVGGITIRGRVKRAGDGLSDEDVAREIALCFYNQERTGIPAFIPLGVMLYENRMVYKVSVDGGTGPWAFTPSGVGGAMQQQDDFNQQLVQNGRRAMDLKLGYYFDPKSGQWGSNRIFGPGQRKAGYVENLTHPGVQMLYFDSLFSGLLKNHGGKLSEMSLQDPAFEKRLGSILFDYNGNRTISPKSGQSIQSIYRTKGLASCVYFAQAIEGIAPGMEREGFMARTQDVAGSRLVPGQDYVVHADPQGGHYTAVLIKAKDHIGLAAPDGADRGLTGREFIKNMQTAGAEPLVVFNGPYYDWVNYAKKTMAPTDLVVVDGKVVWRSVVDTANDNDPKRKKLYKTNWKTVKKKAAGDIEWHKVFWVGTDGQPHIEPVSDYMARQDPQKPDINEGVRLAIGGGPSLFVDGQLSIRQDKTDRERTQRSLIITTTDGDVIFLAIRSATYEKAGQLALKAAGELGVEIKDAVFMDGGASTKMLVAGEKGSSFRDSDRRLPIYLTLNY